MPAREVRVIAPPAEPAEEETKAEVDGERDALAMWLTGYGIPDLMAEGIATALLHDYQLKGTASSPVVPAPTETEWQTWQEVPEGVKYESGAKYWGAARKYVNRSGVRMSVVNGEAYPSTTDESKIQGLAPFVAAEEG